MRPNVCSDLSRYSAAGAASHKDTEPQTQAQARSETI